MTTDKMENQGVLRIQSFSLAELMLFTLILGVLLGVTQLPLSQNFYVAYAATLAGLVVTILVLARFVKVRLLRMLVAVAVLGFLIAFVENPQRRWQRIQPRQRLHLHQIAAAMAAYCGEYGVLPPPYIADAQGIPMHSWRVLILSYLGERQLYDQYRFDEPWDGPNNKKLHNRLVDVYRFPDDYPVRFGTVATDTHYVVVVRRGTVFPGGPNKVSFADVANGDGTANTILVAEVHGSGIHWMEPRDLDFAAMDFQVNGIKGNSISSKHSGGAMVVMVDGSVRYLDDTTPPQEVRRLITISDDRGRK